MKWVWKGTFTSGVRAEHHLDTHYPDHIPQRYNGGAGREALHYSRIVCNQFGAWNVYIMEMV